MLHNLFHFQQNAFYFIILAKYFSDKRCAAVWYPYPRYNQG